MNYGLSLARVTAGSHTRSLVLRCDDCINYHLIRCHELGATAEEIEEVMTVGLVVGGSIVIPHMRRAFQAWEELEGEGEI